MVPNPATYPGRDPEAGHAPRVDVRPVDVSTATPGGAVVVGNVPDGVGLTKR